MASSNMLRPLLYLSALLVYQAGPASSMSVCTLTGPSIINMKDERTVVTDRCVYNLMFNHNYKLMAAFKDRRRKDVSFVDSLVLELTSPPVKFYLEQDGRVLDGDIELNLTAEAQDFHTVEVSKDQSGVHLKLSVSTHDISLFFNGNTAQILFEDAEGPGSAFPPGLCSSNDLVVNKNNVLSSSSCNSPYIQPAATIDSSAVDARCNLLLEEPFSACHNQTDQAPYFNACMDLLSSYPMVDGLNCEFLEAYTRACSLHGNVTLGDWRTDVGCSPPQAFCQDHVCSTHEFCGRKYGTQPGCFCRAIFASPYRSAGTLGEQTVCSQNSASLTLYNCLLEENNIDYKALHLNEQSCKGEMQHEMHTVTFNFDNTNTCGTMVTANNSQIIYNNAIMSQNSSDVITRQDQVRIDFSCFYTQPELRTVSFTIKDSSVIQQITSGAWNYNLTMKAYTDAARTQVVESDVQLNQKIWVELDTEGLEGGLVAVVTDSCWATSESSPNASQRYDLIINGCANSADETVRVEGNGVGTSNFFSFNMFQFSGSAADVYLHCQLNLCITQNKSCAPVCNGARRRRSARAQYVDEAPAFITMTWSN